MRKGYRKAETAPFASGLPQPSSVRSDTGNDVLGNDLAVVAFTSTSELAVAVLPSKELRCRTDEEQTHTTPRVFITAIERSFVDEHQETKWREAYRILVALHGFDWFH